MRVHKGGCSGMVARTVECVLYFSWEPGAEGATPTACNCYGKTRHFSAKVHHPPETVAAKQQGISLYRFNHTPETISKL